MAGTANVKEQDVPTPTVAACAESCLNSFQRCLNQAAAIHARELSLVEDQLARLSLWCSNISVFALGRGSLDHRLREAPDVQDAISGVLEALDYRLHGCSRIINSIAPTASDGQITALDERLDEALQRISDEISLLHKFSNTIRRSSKETQNQKAEKTFRIKDDDGNDAELFLSALFANYIRDRFPGASEAIRERLATTMLLRRKRILYRRSRYGNNPIRTRAVPVQPLITRPEARPTMDQPKEPKQATPYQVLPIVSRDTTQSVALTATTLSPGSFQRASTPSAVSVSKSVALTRHDEIHFPPPPLGIVKVKYNRLKRERAIKHLADLESIPGYNEGGGLRSRHFVDVIAARNARLQETLANDWEECLRGTVELTCPFCFCALPVKNVTDEKKWILHVKNDLDPYVCMFENCDSPEHLYNHSNEWINHMREHSLRWRCIMKSHGDFVCATRDEYLRHMKTAHPGKLTDAQLGVLASRNGRPVENMFMSCPLCGVEDVDGGIPNHLVGHLRLLALKSLPIYEEGTEEYDESDSEQNSLATSRPRTRSTIRDDRDRLGAVTRGDSTSSSGEDSNPELADHLKTTDKRPELENDDASDVAPYGKGRGSEWGFIPATWGPSLEPEDPIVKALSRPVPPRRKPRVIRMDPDCAICYKPVAAGCPCESIALEQSVQQAESRVMRPLLQKGRTWVKVHAVNHLHRVWEEEGFRPFKRHREVQEDKEPHGDHQNEQDEDQQHRHGQLGKPQEEQQASEMKPTLPSQEEVNDEWARRIQTFPEMAEHFFGLFEFTLPTDDDVKQIKSDLLSRAEQVIRNGQPEKG